MKSKNKSFLNKKIKNLLKEAEETPISQFINHDEVKKLLKIKHSKK